MVDTFLTVLQWSLFVLSVALFGYDRWRNPGNGDRRIGLLAAAAIALLGAVGATWGFSAQESRISALGYFVVAIGLFARAAGVTQVTRVAVLIGLAIAVFLLGSKLVFWS